MVGAAPPAAADASLPALPEPAWFELDEPGSVVPPVLGVAIAGAPAPPAFAVLPAAMLPIAAGVVCPGGFAVVPAVADIVAGLPAAPDAGVPALPVLLGAAVPAFVLVSLVALQSAGSPPPQAATTSMLPNKRLCRKASWLGRVWCIAFRELSLFFRPEALVA